MPPHAVRSHINPHTSWRNLTQSLSQLERDIHLQQSPSEALGILKHISVLIDTSSDDEMLSLTKTSIGTEFVMCWSKLTCRFAFQAVRIASLTGYTRRKLKMQADFENRILQRGRLARAQWGPKWDE
ncbi:hypothetical protein BV22DRAFT_1131707 [Leucogyrophana mollusca]|uniref:Uncharacterized protein n=1 Tax=Leucogyrophana mollusca TaxID=85980 RepID=A0ACB8BB18_9AGAM|nr:hypothetical protein BV22DRAFT_1131707 [Leucogyrophana mollusca]